MWLWRSRDQFHTGFMSLKLKSSDISFHSNFDSNGAMISQFCTCRDSSAVMTCTKLWHDLIISFHWRAMHIFPRFGLWAHKPFVKWAQKSWMAGSQSCQWGFYKIWSTRPSPRPNLRGRNCPLSVMGVKVSLVCSNSTVFSPHGYIFPIRWSNQLNQSERLICAPLAWITTDPGNGLVSSLCQAIAWSKFWFIINCTLGNKLQWFFSRLTKIIWKWYANCGHLVSASTC